MSKKTILILISLFGVVAIVLVLFWTVFALSSVTVEFSSTLSNLNVTDEEIVEAANFSYGSCVFFDGKSKYVENIYDAASENENLAYVRVVNIETVFPNKYVIHVSEREELFAVDTGTNYLICDRDLRVLRVESTYSAQTGQAMMLSGLSILNETVAVGDFLDVEESSMAKLYSSFLSSNHSYSEVCGKFSSLELSDYQDDLDVTYTKLTLSTYSGRTFEVCNIDFALSEKIALMYAYESSLFSSSVDSSGNFLNSNNEIIYVIEQSTGELISASSTDEGAVPLTTTLVSECVIRVDNLILSDYVERTTDDIYCALVHVVSE